MRTLRVTSIAGLLLACLTSFLHAKGDRKHFDVYDFSKGVDTYHNPTTLPDGFVQDSLNMFFDDKAPATKRQGFTVAWSTKSYSFTGLWTYTDSTNTTWQIARASDAIVASNLTGSAVVLVATVSVNNLVGEANAFGNAYFVDQTQGVYYWNGSTTVYVTGAPHGSIIAQFHNRLWVTGAAVPNGNQLYGSKYYNGTVWTTGVNDTDPVQYSIGLNDNFDNVTALYVYLDTLYVFKHYSTFALYGFGQNTFQISQLTQECGCVDGGSIQTYNGGLKFVSLRGVEDFNGYTCTRISDPVKDMIDPAIQSGSFSAQSWLQSSQADWNAGSFTPFVSLSTTVAPPSLVLSSFTSVDTTSTDFQKGTGSNITYNSTSIQATANTSKNIDITNPGFESGFNAFSNQFTSWYDWDGVSCFRDTLTNTYDHCTIGPKTGLYDYYCGVVVPFGTLKVSVVSCADATELASKSWTFGYVGSCAYEARTITMAGLEGKCVYLKFFDGSTLKMHSEKFIASGSNITFYDFMDTIGAAQFLLLDDFTNGKNSVTSGWYRSQNFDLVSSSPVVLFQSGFTVSNTTPTWLVETATATTGTWASLATSTGSTNTSNRYVRYTSTISATPTSNQDLLTSIDDVSMTATQSTGSWKSPAHYFGSINSFGNFSVQNVLNNGNIAYSICSSTMSTMVPPSACANQTPNTQITISTGTAGSGTYVQWFATFTVTAATQSPTLQSVTVQANSGSNHVPMASTVWDNRYWLSVTTNSANSTNDTVLVLNSRGSWSPFNIHAGAFTQTRGNLYHADSGATGNIYLDNQAWADNGSAINAYIRTKKFSAGDLTADDYFYAIYPSMSNLGACAVNFSYTPDGAASSYSLGSPLQSEFVGVSSVKLPFPVDPSHQNFSQSMDFTIGSNDAICGMQFYGFKALYRQRMSP